MDANGFDTLGEYFWRPHETGKKLDFDKVLARVNKIRNRINRGDPPPRDEIKDLGYGHYLIKLSDE